MTRHKTKHTNIQWVNTLTVALTGFLFCLEYRWGNYTSSVYTLIAIVLCLIGGFTFIFYRMYSRPNVIAMFLLPLWLIVSCVANFGIHPASLLEKGPCLLITVVFLYILVLASDRPNRTLHLFVLAMVIGLILSDTAVLFNACRSLLSEVPTGSTMTGIFKIGRLTGYGNANVFGFSAAALCMLSLVGRCSDNKKVKIFYTISGIYGAVLLGLTNSRTSMVGVSLAVGILVFRTFYISGKHWTLAVVLGLAATASAIGLLYLPTFIFRRACNLYGTLSGNSNIAQNVQTLASRSVYSDSATLQDRGRIWGKVISDAISNPRRALFGISPVSTDRIGSVYTGHHEIPTSHAHNAYLEVLRLYGFPGFAIWLVMVIKWCISGIRTLFDHKAQNTSAALAAIALSILIMGLVEQVPFPGQCGGFLNILFFVACAYYSRARR